MLHQYFLYEIWEGLRRHATECPSSEFLRLRAAQIKGGSGSFAGLSETE